MHTKTNQLRTDLRIFFIIITLLLIIGVLFVYSASSVYALETFHDAHYCIKKQITGLVIGLFLLILAAHTPLKRIKKLIPPFFFISLGLTALTIFSQFAHRSHGSSRWVRIFGITFQPSELLKIALILYLAYFLEKKSLKNNDSWSYYACLLLILALPSIILLKQPDFGCTVTLLLTACALLFVTQPNIKYLVITILCSLPITALLIIYFPYRLKRILIFLNPWEDAQGAGFQIIQSLIAIGSGGFFGTGIGYSKQKFFYLPMQHTDFIFAIIGEETGFIGLCFLITLYIMLLYFGLRIACNLTSRFALLGTLGFTVLISLQAVINMTVASRLAPTKGIGLPFISYGSTALITNLLMVGLIINFVRNNNVYGDNISPL